MICGLSSYESCLQQASNIVMGIHRLNLDIVSQTCIHNLLNFMIGSTSVYAFPQKHLMSEFNLNLWWCNRITPRIVRCINDLWLIQRRTKYVISGRYITAIQFVALTPDRHTFAYSILVIHICVPSMQLPHYGIVQPKYENLHHSQERDDHIIVF